MVTLKIHAGFHGLYIDTYPHAHEHENEHDRDIFDIEPHNLGPCTNWEIAIRILHPSHKSLECKFSILK